MSFRDFGKHGQYYGLYKQSSLSIDPHWRKKWVTVVVRISTPAFAVCRVSACISPVPGTYAGMGTIEGSRWYRHGVDIGECGCRKHGLRDELLEVEHVVTVFWSYLKSWMLRRRRGYRRHSGSS